MERARAAVAEETPPGATVLVVSRGDRELVRLEGRSGAHFPQDADGNYLGHHPADSAEAVAHLEQLRSAGAGYLVFPPTATWWLEHYEEFALHLSARYERLDRDACVIYRLG